MSCYFLLIFFSFFCAFIPFGHNISGDCVNIAIKQEPIAIKQEPIKIKREQLDDDQITMTEKMKMKILNEEFEIKNIGTKKGSSNQRVKAEKNEQLIKMEKFGNHSKGKSSSAKNHQKIRASTSTSSSSLECQVNSSDDDYVASLSEEEADSEDNSSDLEVTDDEELYDSSASKSLASSSLTNHQGREKLKKKSKSNENVDNSREMLIIKQFDKLKDERVKKNKFANRAQIDAEIAHELGVSRRTIYLWKKKLGLRCKKLCYPQKDKRIILQRFEKMKKEYKEKLIASTCYEIEIKIAKELGVNRSTITDWRKEFGLNKWRTYTEVEKLELIGKYREVKNRNPHLPYCKIAAKLNVLQRTILRWIQEFRNKKEHETTTTITTTTADFDSKDGSSSKMIQSANSELWTWNMATKKRN